MKGIPWKIVGLAVLLALLIEWMASHAWPSEVPGELVACGSMAIAALAVRDSVRKLKVRVSLTCPNCDQPVRSSLLPVTLVDAAAYRPLSDLYWARHKEIYHQHCIECRGDYRVDQPHQEVIA